MPPRIVVVGSSNTDLVVRAPTLPAAGQTVLGSSFMMAPGGKGANQAVAAARLGAHVTFVGRLGADDLGREARRALEEDGVDTSLVVTDTDAPSGVALIVVNAAGENAIAVAPGANARLSPADVDRAAPALEAADVVLLQLEIPMPTVARAVERARRAGVRVILNPAPVAPLDPETIPHVSVLTPNAGEAAALAAGLGRDRGGARGREDGGAAPGRDAGADPAEAQAAARAAAARLREAGVPRIVVTLGPDGALLADEDGSRVVPGYRVVPVDTTAAGDAFNGALAVALAEGATLEAAAGFANRAAALSTTRPGAQPSLPTRREVETFLDSDRGS